MEDFKKSYLSYLDRLKKRQEWLGLTNVEVANLLGIRPNNYERLLKGAYPMSVPRFEQLCTVLGLGICVLEYNTIEDFRKCVEEELVEDTDVVDGN